MTRSTHTAALSTGVTVSYVEQGDPSGVPMLMLHGYSDSLLTYEPLLPHLPDSVHAYAYTQRGHGDASRPMTGYRPRDFAADVANDALPRFTYIEPAFFGEATWPPFGTDYHPPFKLKDGEWFLKKIYDILRTHPAVFEKTLFIVTFDEPGGTYDHLVPPTNAVRPSSEPYDLPFGRYGLRVPTLLISPCVPAGCVFRAGYYPETPETTTPRPYDHTSVLATLMKWLNIPYGDESSPGWLGARTAVAPTFEEVIGPVQNTTWPDVKPFHCHDTWFGKEIPDELIPQLIERISGFERGTAQHAELVTHVQSAPTERDAHRRLLQLREMHGDHPRNGDLCCASATSVPSG